MPIDKAELFDLYHEAFPKILNVTKNYWMSAAGRYQQIEAIVNGVEKKIEEAA